MAPELFNMDLSALVLVGHSPAHVSSTQGWIAWPGHVESSHKPFAISPAHNFRSLDREEAVLLNFRILRLMFLVVCGVNSIKAPQRI